MKQHKHIVKNTFFPNSVRFCLSCELARKFEYYKPTGHSICNMCGGFTARKATPEELHAYKNRVSAGEER